MVIKFTHISSLKGREGAWFINLALSRNLIPETGSSTSRPPGKPEAWKSSRPASSPSSSLQLHRSHPGSTSPASRPCRCSQSREPLTFSTVSSRKQAAKELLSPALDYLPLWPGVVFKNANLIMPVLGLTSCKDSQSSSG